MSGGIIISRELWNDRDFRDAEMSQREAFIWMVAEASWKEREREVSGIRVVLKRGQLAHSTRFMAGKFQWSEARVRRYLNMLKNRRTIDADTDAGVTVVTICNYDKYQSSPRVSDAPRETKPTQERRTSDANENKDEIKGNIPPKSPQGDSGKIIQLDDRKPVEPDSDDAEAIQKAKDSLRRALSETPKPTGIASGNGWA